MIKSSVPDWLYIAGATALIVAVICVWVTIAYVVGHFIIKFW